ncbi:MAG: hypothetical protein UX31_C0007G0052 [Candidatus Nomurabacteria bacterium GW2011_GWA1_46_11]|uniref:Uncharacterized protein n=1 Tax=Candidatus Nomurabacteria bacterium GW2011_GWA1_46_11 TaxID=1618732 RepID=A0A0G1NNR6_9BACT|nr:MAG: hypothetical protein UX31_C0007G0052 [Candidatus Nomurabacteria bacterium GW2011_GWA1_46_11]
MWYLLFYAIGIAIGLISPRNSMEDSLIAIGPITITAFVASLLVPFAAFASTERWQKFALQYAPIPLIGVCSVVVWITSGPAGVLVLAWATVVHAAYWTSGIHSRAYRLDQFRIGFAPDMPHTARLVAMLNGNGQAHLADVLVKALLGNTEVDFEVFRSFLNDKTEESRAFTAISGEIRHERNRWLRP